MSATSNNFVRGAAILALAGLASRVLGAIFRIVLAAILGDEGIGLYQYAYPIYSTLLVISTAGVPVALSKMMAEHIALNDYREALRVFKIAFYLLLFSGLTVALLLGLSAEFIALRLIKDAKAYYPLLAIGPAILFVTVMAALRGFFQGQQNMAPTAFSQLLEQLARVAGSVVLLLALLPRGLEMAAAGATAGASIGGLAGLAMLSVLYFKKKNELKERPAQQAARSGEPAGAIIKKIFSLAVPVTIGGLVIPLMNMIDLAVVPRQLIAGGFSLEKARALYGQLTGMAGSVVYFPNVIALAISISLVPAISEACALKNDELVKSRSALGIKLTVLFSLPATLGLFLLAEPVTLLLFNNAQAGFSLAYLSWSVVALCLYVATTGLIQGLGRPVIPALNMFYGGLIKAVLAWFLTANPALNVGGAALASVAGIAFAAALNLYQVHRLTGWRASFKELVLLPACATLVMSLAVFFTYRGLFAWAAGITSAAKSNILSCFGAISAGLIVYAALIIVSGDLKKNELLAVPYAGEALVRLLEKLKIKA